jgi:asparagine synthase (glutamine-hydrolysing)
MKGSPDIDAARLVAKHLDTEHYEVTFSPQECIDTLRQAIYTTETFDFATVPASAALYLLSKYIKENTDTTVIFPVKGQTNFARDTSQ